MKPLKNRFQHCLHKRLSTERVQELIMDGLAAHTQAGLYRYASHGMASSFTVYTRVVFYQRAYIPNDVELVIEGQTVRFPLHGRHMIKIHIYRELFRSLYVKTAFCRKALKHTFNSRYSQSKKSGFPAPPSQRAGVVSLAFAPGQLRPRRCLSWPSPLHPQPQ